MKKILLIVFTLCASSAHALDAVITVLEAPLLQEPSTQAKVVQHLRKGDVIRIHPGYNPSTEYDHMAPTPEKQKAILKRWRESPEGKEDPIFLGDYDIDPNDMYVPTLDRSGQTVYVLREHIFIYFENEKELTQTPKYKDETDYRLEEPLPKKYPLYSTTGYRGQLTLGIAQTYIENYPYAKNIRNKGHQSPLDMTVMLMKRAPDDKYDRLYIGGMLGIRTFKNEYILSDNRQTKEQFFKLGLGPAISYDAFKSPKNRMGLSIAMNIWLWDTVKIEQTDNQSLSDKRSYRAFTFAPRAGLQYHRKQILPDIDFVIGAFAEAEIQHTYSTDSKASQATYWNNEGTDKFSAPTLFNLVGIIGFQSAY